LVADHYAKLGFKKISEDPSGSGWELLVDEANPETASMKVVSHGFSATMPLE
jgi:hypothetical protein